MKQRKFFDSTYCVIRTFEAACFKTLLTCVTLILLVLNNLN